MLARITTRQQAWADALGAAIGIDTLERARDLLAAIRPHVSMPAEGVHVTPTEGGGCLVCDAQGEATEAADAGGSPTATLSTGVTTNRAHRAASG